MSYYYKYNFISPEPIYSIIKEELKSYFDTGAIDDLMLPTYLDKCLRKLGRSSYVISQETLYVEDFEARLPDNFFAVREAWMCSEIPLTSYQDANSFYTQTSTNIIQVSPMTVGGQPCNNPQCTNPQCDGMCQPEVIQAVYKTNNTTPRAYRREFLLKPGNISAKQHCTVEYNNHNYVPNASSLDSFDIRDNKFVTNFRCGVVHLLMYVTEYDEVQNQLIPDNYRIKEYVEAFIKYKLFEMLTNQTNDETFNQLEKKLQYYKQLSDEAYILADIEIKKSTVYQKQNKIVEELNRFNKYELQNGYYGNKKYRY